MPIRQLPGAIVVGLLLLGPTALAAGCATPPAPPPFPTVSPLVLPSPTGTPLSQRDAAARYIEIVEPYNKAVDVLFDDSDADQIWWVLRRDIEKLAAVVDREILELAGSAWSAEVRPLVDSLVASKVSTRQRLSNAAHARTEAEFFRLFTAAFPGDDSCVEPGAIRHALGLPAAHGCEPLPVVS